MCKESVAHVEYIEAMGNIIGQACIFEIKFF